MKNLWQSFFIIITKNKTLMILLFLSFLAQLLFVFLSGLSTLVRNDDAFYYFTIARNFPTTKNLSFSGVGLTNGIQPLWTLILCLVSYLFNGLSGSPILLLRVFFTISVLCNVASGIFIYLLCEDIFGRKPALIVSCLWLFGPYLFLKQLQGMENSLHALCLSVTLWYYVTRLHGRQVRWVSHAIFGLLLGITFLARVDEIFLLLVILAIYIWQGRKDILTSGKNVTALLVFFSIPVIPYLAYNISYFGHLFPISGAVKLYRSKIIYNQLGGFLSVGSFKLVFQSVLEGIKGMINSVLGKGFYTVLIMKFDANFKVKAILALAFFSLVLVFLFNHKVRNHLKHSFSQFNKKLNFFLPFVVLHFIISVVLYPNQILYAGVGWWFLPEYFLIFFMLANLLISVWEGFRFRWLNYFFMIFLIVNMLLSNYFIIFNGTIYPDTKFSLVQMSKYEAARWINENTHDMDILGSFNAGIVGYFSNRRVINLDGLVNDYNFLEYLKKGKLVEYVHANNIKYIADYGKISDSDTSYAFRGIPIKTVMHVVSIPDYSREYYIVEVAHE